MKLAEDFKFIAIVSTVSIVCIGVFLLPLEIQNMLKVRHAIFNPLTYITASFVHDDLQHLGFNLFGFILFTFLLYSINKKVSKQKIFFYSLLMMFVVLPLLNYGLLFYSAIYKSIEFGHGLSLVGSSIIGFTVPSLILFFKGRLEKFNPMLFLLSMSLLTLCLIFLPYATSSSQLLLSVFCAILGFVFGMLEFRKIWRFVAESFKQRDRTRMIESYMVVVTLWFYFVSILSLFPPNIASQIGITDIISHYIGLLFGIVPFSVYSTRASGTGQ